MSTAKHIKYWKDRKIDWKTSYTDTWNHPHRELLSGILSTFRWVSLVEVGCGGGANLINFVKRFPGCQLGGVDVNADAIETAKKYLNNAWLKVGTADNLMMSDNSTDVALTDMCLIYVDPTKIDKHIEELKRISRHKVLLCEFHSRSLFQRLKLWWRRGYYAYNWPKLLKKHGFTDVRILKIPHEAWPGGEPQKTFGYIILANVPSRK